MTENSTPEHKNPLAAKVAETMDRIVPGRKTTPEDVERLLDKVSSVMESLPPKEYLFMVRLSAETYRKSAERGGTALQPGILELLEMTDEQLLSRREADHKRVRAFGSQTQDPTPESAE